MRPRYSSVMMRVFASSALIVALAACGGGGGGGSSSGSSGGSGTGGGTGTGGTPVNGGIPTVFEASFEENGSFANFAFADFTVNAPSNEEPQNLALIGADAEPFTVNFEIAAPDSNGDRVVSTFISTSNAFNYEDPQDQNMDNLYEFELTGTFQGTNLNSDFKVSIIDLDDDAEVRAFTIRGETALQTFGIPVVEIPDVTGDGNPELAVTNITGKGVASAYVIDSEFIGSTTADVAVGPNTASGTRFTTTAATDSFTPNTLTALAQADGTGTDLMLSADNMIYVFPIESAADYAAIQGNTDPSTVANRIAYSLTSPDGDVTAQLIPDVNGDNINDIAVLLLNGNDGTGEAGIIFGVDGTGTPKTIANGFDVTFNASREFSSFGRAETVEIFSVPDIDGDGVADLIIGQRNFNNDNVIFLKSALLGSPSENAIDLDNLDRETQGFKLQNHVLGSVSIGQDYDNDGSPTLIFSGGNIIDGHEFAAIDPDNRTRLFGNTSVGLNAKGIGSYTTLIEDIDGDGYQEYLGSAGTLATVFLINGQTVRDALENPGTIVTQPQEDEFPISLTNFFGSNSDITDAPIYLQATDQFVVPWATDSNPRIETDPGQLVIFDSGVVRDAYLSGATGVTINP